MTGIGRTQPEFPSDRVGRISTAVQPDAGSRAKPQRASVRQVFGEMPLLIKISAVWLILIVFGAIYAKLDVAVFDGSLPLQNPNLQTNWVSLIVAGISAVFGIVVGGFLGALVGYVRGRTETVIMSMVDVILAFPALVLLLALVSIFEVRDLLVISLVIGVLSIPAYTRVARANSLAISNREFVTAARAIGTRPKTILFREIIPNVLPTLLSYAMVASAFVVVVEGSLSFLGLSVQLPQSTWGNMINQARRDIKVDIYQVLWPSLALSLTVLSLNQVGDWFQKRGSVRDSVL